MTELLDIQGHKIAVRKLNEVTDGVPRFLIHGITASISTWGMDVIPETIKEGPCYGLSLPGHYPAMMAKQLQPAGLTAEHIADVLAIAIKQTVGNQPILLMGHSTGGFASLALALFHPEIVQAVLSVAGFAHGRWTGLLGTNQLLARSGWLGRQMFKAGYEITRGHRTALRFGLRVYTADSAAMYSYPQFESALPQLYSDACELDLDAMLMYFGRMPDIDIMPSVINIKAPVLLMTGTADPIVPPTQSEQMAELIPQSTLVKIPDSGHIIFWERAEQYHHAINEWMTAHL